MSNNKRPCGGGVFNQDILYQLLEEARAAAPIPETSKSRVLELSIEEEYNPPRPKVSEFTLRRNAFRALITQPLLIEPPKQKHPFQLFQTNAQDGQNT
jgi:hypothetical protein